MANMQTQPIFILPEGTLRNSGKMAQKGNLEAAKQVGETVRTTLGPKGMDKMLVDSMGDIVVTNDGVTILERMDIEHPAAKMLVEVAKTQEEEIGDGTTTAVVIAAELLKKAQGLLEQDVHPTIITKGYRIAKEESLKILDSFAIKIDPKKDSDVLKKIAMTAMTGKSAEKASEHLANIAVEAVKLVMDEGGVDMENIKLEKKTGGGTEDTELVKGIIIDKEIAHTSMPRSVSNAKILLVDAALEMKEIETDAKISINSPDQLEAFYDQEEKILKDLADKVIKTGANIVFCQKGIDDIVQDYLAKAGILAARRVKKSDVDALVRATGAKLVSNLEGMSKDDLGFAKLVDEKKVAGERMIFVRECKSPKSVSILIRGGTQHVVDEAERALTDALGDIIAAMETGKVFAGGGAPETQTAVQLRKFAQKFSGREQLAIEAFADALEIIPRTLAENAGLDPIDMLVEMRSAHGQGKTTYGMDVFRGKVIDMEKAGVIEPLKIKTQAIKSASEAAEMILRIDDIVAAAKSPRPEMGMPGGMPQGME